MIARYRQAEKKDKDRKSQISSIAYCVFWLCLSSLILDCSTLGNCSVERQKHTDLDMKKGPWQSRGRTCKQVASPEGKEARLRKPYKKPRQVIVLETQEGDSEGPTQLGHGESVTTLQG